MTVNKLDNYLSLLILKEPKSTYFYIGNGTWKFSNLSSPPKLIIWRAVVNNMNITASQFEHILEHFGTCELSGSP
jgi:hypothetical protein